MLLNLVFSSALALTAVLPSTVACKPDEPPKAAAAEPLKVGSAAPALQVSRWVKGNGPSEFEQGKVYVVEFWATWCKPCLDAIPHLTQMAREYSGKVTFVGVNVWEEIVSKAVKEATGETLDVEKKIDAFVRGMGDKMDYFVARDTASGYMANTWLLAAGQNGIPCAFIVDGNGKIAWIGHPMDSMDEAINAVLANAE